MATCVNRLWMLAALILGPIAGTTVPAVAKTWTSGTFVYADLCTDHGGRVGRRITLKRSPNGDAVTYESASAEPVQLHTVAFENETQSVSFVLETASGLVTFHGRMESGTLTGIVEDAEGAHDVRLPRVLRTHADQACQGGTTGSIAEPR